VISLLTVMIGAGLAVLAVLRIRRQREKLWADYYLDKNREYLAYVSAHIVEEDRLRPPAAPLSKHELRVIGGKLSEWIEALDGAQRDKLVELCRDLGLVDMELKRLRSFWRWQRIDAAFRLGTMRAREALPGLHKLLEKEAHDASAFVAARAIAKCAASLDDLKRMTVHMLKTAGDSAELLADILAASTLDVKPLFEELLQSEDIASQRLALTGLFGQNRPVSPELFQHLVRSEDIGISRLAVRLLLRQPQALTGAELRTLADHPDGEIRAEVARSIGELGDPSGVSLLRELLGDESWLVRYFSARALIALDEPGFAALCEEAAKRESSASGRAAWDAIHEELSRADPAAADVPETLRLNRLKLMLLKKMPNEFDQVPGRQAEGHLELRGIS
jgi:HEAT repeat protein